MNTQFFLHYSEDNNVRRVNNVLHICTSNDANGNPRRLIVCLGEYGHVAAVFNEGHDWGGLYQLHKPFATWTNLHAVRVNVTISEFNKWKAFNPSEVCGEVVKVTTQPELPAFQQ